MENILPYKTSETVGDVYDKIRAQRGFGPDVQIVLVSINGLNQDAPQAELQGNEPMRKYFPKGGQVYLETRDSPNGPKQGQSNAKIREWRPTNLSFCLEPVHNTSDSLSATIHDMDEQKQSAEPDALIRREVGLGYWNATDPDINGMLGGVLNVNGFSSISKVDLQGSRGFLAKLGIGMKNGRHRLQNVLEGGAGIGRVTEGLLSDLADHIDVIEPVSKFNSELSAKRHVRRVFNVGLEEWTPTGTEYDLVWLQWCTGYLTDAQLVCLLEQCKQALNPDGGVIVVKENLSTSGVDLFDETDSSVTRQDTKFRDLFRRAGLQIVRTDIQRGFPNSFPRRLFPVRMYALKPKAMENDKGSGNVV
ncbi:hypothetical protein SCUP234_06776 [Seiridium cupressi]